MIKKERNSIREILDTTTISSIVMISIFVSLLSLSIPIAAQTLINLIAFGKLLQPVLTLSLIVLILMIALGALNIWQIIIIEIIQQKLMVKISLNLSRQFTHLSLENFSSHHGPELVNRFFEVTTINKSLANLLLYGINLLLQLFFGLLLLVFYHPLFLVFDGFILFSILIIVFIPFHKALNSAKDECTKKHQIGSWLEELLTNRFLFRFNNYQNYATYQTDKRLVSFLKARNSHFIQLIKHQIGFYLLAALASSLLLGLGGYLVINDQLSLGQLVAAEIVMGSLIYSFMRFSHLLENYYDLMASESKIDSVLNLPVEMIKTELNELLIPVQSMTLQIKNKNEATCVPGNPLLIEVNESQQGLLITEFIFGFRNDSTLNLLVNGTLCAQEYRCSLREHSLLIRDKEWFAGTIYDNLRLNQSLFSTEELKNYLNTFNLMNKIMSLSEGLKTIIYDWENVFTESELIQLIVIRALLIKPQLLIIDRAFDYLNHEQIELILVELAQLNNTLMIIVTERPKLIPFSNCLVFS